MDFSEMKAKMLSKAAILDHHMTCTELKTEGKVVWAQYECVKCGAKLGIRHEKKEAAASCTASLYQLCPGRM